MYAENPTGGFGVADVQLELKSRPFDHLSVQPFPNEPCQIVASSAGPDSDSGFIAQAWADARTQNPDVQLWVYQQWPDPLDFNNCITGNDKWMRSDDAAECAGASPPVCWKPPVPEDWDAAVQNELAYDEAIVDELMQLEPDAPRPYIVPGGLGLSRLHAAIDAGRVPGFTSFFGQIFQAGTDIHLTRPGAYFISLIFYASMFQSNPAGTELDPSYGVTSEQALVLQTIAWETVTSYAASGVAR
jgi:hypothetical protein